MTFTTLLQAAANVFSTAAQTVSYLGQMLGDLKQLRSALFLIVATCLIAESTNSAFEQFQNLQANLHKSHIANDWQSNLLAAKELSKLLNESPGSLVEVARAQVHVGDFEAAFQELQQFVRMGQSIPLPPDFAPLLTKPEFAGIERAMEANRTPVSLASTAFLLPDSSLLAEDVDYDPSVHRFLVTSVRQKKIIAVKEGGATSDFATAPDHWPMMAIKIDRAHRLVWATEVAMQGFNFAPQADWGRSALLCYDLRSGKLLRRVEAPRGTALGDMALTTDGDVVVSDGDGGGLYRLAAKASALDSHTLDRLDHGDFISPQTPAMHPDGKHMFVPDYVRGIAVLDLSTRQVRWLSTRGRFALDGVDGLYFDRGTLIAVQNGASPERVVAFTLDPTLSEVAAETILERSTETLGDPTHGVVVGNDFYYIANSGWDILDDHGNVKPGAKPTQPRMMRRPSPHH
jgi:sugar lactone lactonase YvrE